jgi:hypothetical protein
MVAALHVESRIPLLQAAETNFPGAGPALRRRRWLIPAQGCRNPGTSMSSSFGEL